MGSNPVDENVRISFWAGLGGEVESDGDPGLNRMASTKRDSSWRLPLSAAKVEYVIRDARAPADPIGGGEIEVLY